MQKKTSPAVKLQEMFLDLSDNQLATDDVNSLAERTCISTKVAAMQVVDLR